MMGTTADKLEYLQGTKAAIKQAIVNKGVAVPDGTTFRGYAEKIGDIIDVPDLSNPGAAGDLRSGKQLVGADGSIVTGTLPEVIQATPTISVSSGGLITATTEQEAGYVPGGTKSSTKQLTTQGAKTVTPGTTTQTAVASGRYTTGDVDVAGDANLKAENIAEGVSIFGVAGTHSGGGSGGYSGIEFVNESTFMQNQQRAAGILVSDGSYWLFLLPPLIGNVVASKFGPLDIFVNGVGGSYYETYDNYIRVLDENGDPRFEFSFSSGIVTNDIFQGVYFMLYI